MACGINEVNEELNAAKEELKELVSTLFHKLNDLQEVDDESELDPHRNIIDNFMYKQQMRCDSCRIQFESWSQIDLHNGAHHANQPEDPRKCTLCNVAFDSWQEKDTHMLTNHPLDSESTPVPPVAGIINVMWCCSLCSDSKHFVDYNHWQRHFESFHSQYMGSIIQNWMSTQCDIKGRGIIFDCTDAEIECTLCDVKFPFNPDIFNFHLAHGHTNCHIENIKKFIMENRKIPVKFLKVLNPPYEITGLFHPHELQGSCCCRILGCEFCGLHKSMINKFPNKSVVWCNICQSNFKWTNIESGLQHVISDEHYQKLCDAILLTGVSMTFNETFKKQGQFIESISNTKRPV